MVGVPLDTKCPFHVCCKILIPLSRFSRICKTDLHDVPARVLSKMFDFQDPIIPGRPQPMGALSLFGMALFNGGDRGRFQTGRTRKPNLATFGQIIYYISSRILKNHHVESRKHLITLKKYGIRGNIDFFPATCNRNID